ncbi:PREDICTED: solute carrier family 2, facilitated glucose transporter member 11-like isoform X1 [Crocodylus porosus]|uniref:solute carrier family 2, facilitated glucose transporter member 11-like isoform X1 n=2 Tax=Crocodylus porosus TaxID=8502 RepID=UPI000939C231|nr:PREDICTED: solute carrier family 2, facilitated glucose transporter member 11-like isoform X1 [Crocodylus porosus]
MDRLFSDLVQYQKLFQMIFMLGIGGCFTIGFQISMINYPSVHVKRFINETWLERYGSPLHQKTLMLIWSSIVSIYGIGGLLGCLCSGYLTTKYGKKNCLMYNNLLIIATAFLMGFSKMAKSFEMVLSGRFFYGISAGFCMTIHPQYAGEVSPKKLRGFANSSAGLFWSLGKVLGQIMGLSEFLGTESLWPLLMAFIGIAALIQLVTLPFFPESPPYLLIQKDDEEGCLKAMDKLWGEMDHQAELNDMKEEKAATKSIKSMSILQVMKDPSLRWQLYILVTVIIVMQLCGINAVYFYTFEVLCTAGFEEGRIPYISLGVGLCELFSTILCTFTIERFGRKTLLWKGYAMMALVLVLLTITLSLQNKYNWTSYCSVILIFLFVFFFGIGPCGATMSIMVEIFNQSSRSSAFVIGGCLNWVGLFVIGMIFPFIVESLGPFCFLIFMGVVVGSGIFIYLFLPETKGKSVTEITEEFTKLYSGNKLSSIVRRNFLEEHMSYTSF